MLAARLPGLAQVRVTRIEQDAMGFKIQSSPTAAVKRPACRQLCRRRRSQWHHTLAALGSSATWWLALHKTKLSYEALYFTATMVFFQR